MEMKTASGEIVSLDFEPIASRAADPRNHVDTIVKQINDGWYDGMIQGGTVVDLGANIGLFTIYAATKADRVIALEPSPEHFMDLLRLLEHRPMANVTAMQAAVTTNDGTIDFYMNDENRTMSALFPTGRGRKTTVCGMSLPMLFRQSGIETVDFLKCDIEGYEEELLGHGSFDQVVPRIRSALIEVHNFKDWGDANAIAERVNALVVKAFPHTRRMTRDAIYGWRD